MPKKYSYMSQCGHPGCREAKVYKFNTIREQKEWGEGFGGLEWRCDRHHRMLDALSPAKRKVIIEGVVRTVEDSGYIVRHHEKVFDFGDSQISTVHGQGFTIYADDFPDGAILKLTAEISL
jgi:hypothetical protein